MTDSNPRSRRTLPGDHGPRRKASGIRHLATESATSLDLPLVLEYFAGRAQTERGKSQIREMKPRPMDELTSHFEDLRHWKDYLDNSPPLRFPPLPQAQAFARQPRLDPFDADLLRDIRDCLAFWLETCDTSLLAFLHLDDVDPDGLRELAADLARLFNPEGHWRRDITPRLATLFRELDRTHQRLTSTLDQALSTYATFLSESMVYQRNGRQVLAVKADFKGRVRGIVQDFSASGHTVFIEPEGAIAHQNTLVQLNTEIAEEIWNIRCSFTERILACDEFCHLICPSMARWDACQAMLLTAMEAHCELIVPNTEGNLELKTARHPYLDQGFAEARRRRSADQKIDRHRMIPFHLSLNAETRGLVISGPNTGGKTVTLKTTGLLSMMANVGLPVPVDEGSAVPYYTWILADIGDRQSMAESLSSFASHLVFIREMLNVTEPNALILLDELGSGTDPQEGNALSQAIIELMMERGFHVIITTHHQVLCTMALNHPHMENGSMAFDPGNLRPTYRFMMGIPGRSHALDIAAQAGLQPDILTRAQSLLDDNQVDLQGALEELQRKTKEIQQIKSKLRRDQRRLVGKIQKTKHRESRLQEIQEELETKSKARIRAKVEKAEQALREVLDDVESKKKRRSFVSQFAKVKKELVPEEAHPKSEVRQEPSGLPVSSWRRGDRVFIVSFGQNAELVSVEKSNVRVACNGMGLLVDRDDVVHLKRRASQAPKILEHVEIDGSDAQSFEIKLLGYHVDDALIELDGAIDRAIRQELPFLRIIHGHGTGALKTAIRDFLKRHPHRQSWKVEIDPHRDGETDLRFS